MRHPARLRFCHSARSRFSRTLSQRADSDQVKSLRRVKELRGQPVCLAHAPANVERSFRSPHQGGAPRHDRGRLTTRARTTMRQRVPISRRIAGAVGGMIRIDDQKQVLTSGNRRFGNCVSNSNDGRGGKKDRQQNPECHPLPRKRHRGATMDHVASPSHQLYSDDPIRMRSVTDNERPICFNNPACDRRKQQASLSAEICRKLASLPCGKLICDMHCNSMGWIGLRHHGMTG